MYMISKNHLKNTEHGQDFNVKGIRSLKSQSDTESRKLY